MSREIKFRAWHKGKMYPYTHVAVYANVGSVCDDREFGIGGSSSEEVVLMQYTGLKDKNGVEIYEGDIVLTGKYPAVVEYQGTQFTVYRDGAWCRHLNPDIEEVIGNIHEEQGNE